MELDEDLIFRSREDTINIILLILTIIEFCFVISIFENDVKH